MKIIITDNQYNLLKESFAEKNLEALKKYWTKKKNSGEQLLFDKSELKYWGIEKHSDIIHAQMIFQSLVGDDEFAKKIIKKLLNKTFSTKDFSDKITGGYDFEWVITEWNYQDYDFYLYGQTQPGGTVTLMEDGRLLSLVDAIADEELGWEIQSEVEDVAQDCMNQLILPITGYEVTTSVYVVEE